MENSQGIRHMYSVYIVINNGVVEKNIIYL